MSRPRILSSRALAASLGSAVILLTTACGYAPTPLPDPPETPAPTSAAPAAPPECDNPTQSYDPLSPMPDPGQMPAGSTMAEIQDRGRLIVGTSADTFLLASRNPQSGQIEGFDIDMAKAVAEAIFGDEERIQLRIITAAERIPLLETGEVDIVVRAFSMTCARWDQVGFSEEYYRSGQKILVRQGSDITGLSSLADHKVCAPNGTSSLANLVAMAPEAEPVGAMNHTGCLVLFQRGEVDAITGDDTVLAGLAAQDPYAVVLEEEPFTDEPYGVGVAKENTDLAAFVNGVLARMRESGEWTASYERWLAPYLGAGAGQPVPVHGRG